MENNTTSIIKKVGLYILVVVLLGGAVWGLAKLSAVKGKDNPISGAQTINPVSATAWQRGKMDSKVTLVEYADFQCPACGVYYPLVEQLFKEYGDKVKFEYRHFPLTGVHKNAEAGAVSAESAGRQNKFWEMSSLLYENQVEWSELISPTEQFIKYAEKLGLNIDQFKTDLKSKELLDKVRASSAEGFDVGINSTPSFFLNTNRLQPKSYDEFKQSVERALQENS